MEMALPVSYVLLSLFVFLTDFRTFCHSLYLLFDENLYCGDVFHFYHYIRLRLHGVSSFYYLYVFHHPHFLQMTVYYLSSSHYYHNLLNVSVSVSVSFSFSFFLIYVSWTM